MTERRVDTFFYGLFMDSSILSTANVIPHNPRQAMLSNYALRIGTRATLVPQQGASVWGMIYAVGPSDLETLYGAPGLESYGPEAVLVELNGGHKIPSLVYNLAVAPGPGERNESYALRLRSSLKKLEFPDDYILTIA